MVAELNRTCCAMHSRSSPILRADLEQGYAGRRLMRLKLDRKEDITLPARLDRKDRLQLPVVPRAIEYSMPRRGKGSALETRRLSTPETSRDSFHFLCAIIVFVVLVDL